jgi:hypothetical protein
MHYVELHKTSRPDKNRIKERERERWRSQIACPNARSLVANPKFDPDDSVVIM